MKKELPESNFNLLPLGRDLAMLAKSYFGALTKRLDKSGLDRHFSALILIGEAERKGSPCSQQFLADLLKIDKVTMVRVVDYLIEKNFIVKALNPSDRREYFLKLSPKAKKELPNIMQGIKKLNEITFKGLSKKDIAVFYKALTVMEKNLKDVPSDEYLFRFRKVKKK